MSICRERMMDMSTYACRNREELLLEAREMRTRFEKLRKYSYPDYLESIV